MGDDQVEEMGTGGLGLFTAALGLGEPWQVSGAEFAEDAGRLDLQVDYPRGARFACPEPGCGRDQCPVHDTHDKTWRHLDFFQHKAFLHASVPRVRCPEHGVRLVQVPWARPGSGFTMLFEALVLTFAKATGDETGRRDRPRARHPSVARRGAPRGRRPGEGRLLRRAAGGDG